MELKSLIVVMDNTKLIVIWGVLNIVLVCWLFIRKKKRYF